jgi:SAM-dependent methyltransferase
MIFMGNNKEVSDFDKEVYLKLRKNIRDFLKKQSKNFDKLDAKVLDIAPQIYAGAKEFFVKSQVLTADIDEKSGADYIIDICKNNEKIIPPESFDCIVCTEVLEHTLNPFNAINEIYRLLRGGGGGGIITINSF